MYNFALEAAALVTAEESAAVWAVAAVDAALAHMRSRTS
jgi:hypothetical protein